MCEAILIFKVVGFASFFALAFSSLTFYNVECDSFDKTFCDVQYCYIKAVNRSLKYCSLRIKLLKVPVTSFSVQVALSYRANGWKPFLYNYTVDGCKFLKSKTKTRNPFLTHLYKSLEQFSNLNHTCPYNHDIIVTNSSTAFAENLWTKMLPSPEGQYRIETTLFAYQTRMAKVNIYVNID